MAALSYNERLFTSGIRRFVHLGRFRWLGRTVAAHDPDARSFVEVGCFDGRVLEHLPTSLSRYVGYDANWENGLDLARTRWRECDQYEFRYARSADDMDLSERFDVGICMETLEHIPDADVDGYLLALATVVRRRLYVTVPNEKYLAFAVKYAYHAFAKEGERYTFGDVTNSLLGRMARVERGDHKGFDYDNLLERLERNFVVEKVTAQPVEGLPLCLGMGIGVRARPRG